MLTHEDAIRDEYLDVAEAQLKATARMWDRIFDAILPTDEETNEPREEN